MVNCASSNCAANIVAYGQANMTAHGDVHYQLPGGLSVANPHPMTRQAFITKSFSSVGLVTILVCCKVKSC